MANESLSRAPELLQDMRLHLASQLLEHGIAQKTADDIATDTVHFMRNLWGGQLVYFPKGSTLDNEARDLDIWADFNGHNHSELVSKYGISIQSVYTALRRARSIVSKRSQLNLF